MISSAYQYYLSNYASKEVSRYDAHKKSELRQVYHDIVKLNKRSPLYRFNFTDNVQRFAIDLKENARSFKEVVLDATDEVESGNLLAQKAAFSSDERTVAVDYVGKNPAEEAEGTAYQVEVLELASPQVNTGDFLASNRLDFSIGSHSFDLSIGGSTYEFQFKVSSNSTNLKVQEKLARLVNRSNVGLHAEILRDDNGSSALQLVSLQSGLSDDQKTLFHFESTDTDGAGGTVAMLGLNHMTQAPTNAALLVNGEEMSSSSNTLSLNQAYVLTLYDKTDQGKPVEIGMHKSAKALVSHMQSLADGFNSLYDLAVSRENECISDQLHKDLNYITKRFRHTLDTTGLTVQEDGHIQTDEALVISAASDGTLDAELEHLSNFRGALMRQIHKISLDPLEYIKRTMVSYPNPKHNYANAYQTSVYSGMIFSGYI